MPFSAALHTAHSKYLFLVQYLFRHQGFYARGRNIHQGSQHLALAKTGLPLVGIWSTIPCLTLGSLKVGFRRAGYETRNQRRYSHSVVLRLMEAGCTVAILTDADSPESTLTRRRFRTSTRRPDCRRKSAQMIGCSTLASTKGQRNSAVPIVRGTMRLPYVGMGVPLAATKTLSSLLRATTSAAETGRTLMAAPVSIR